MIWAIIGENGKGDDIKIFEAKSKYYYGRDKIAFAGALAMYMERVKEESSFETGLLVFRDITGTESIKSYRQSEGLYLLTVANAYKQQRDAARTNVDKESASLRLNKLNKAINQMISEEPDEDIKSVYSNYVRTIFD